MQGNKILTEFELNELEYEATMTVNYCPQCGRKLTEDKWHKRWLELAEKFKDKETK